MDSCVHFPCSTVSVHRVITAQPLPLPLPPCSINDADRPDEAFTTDRAVRAGRANAARWALSSGVVWRRRSLFECSRMLPFAPWLVPL